jgi:Flp pilus assembly protein TadG
MRRKSRESGSAMVEFALSALLMFTVCGGMFQFGYSMFVYNQLTSSVRAAARYGALIPYTSTTSTPRTDYSTAVKNVALYGDPAAASGSAPLVRNMAASNVEIAVTMSGTTARQITVRVINFTVDVVFGKITFNQKPSVTFTYNG